MKAEYRDKERRARTLLYHRFDLLGKKTKIDDKIYSIENLDFKIALNELQRSFELFVESKELQEKIHHLIQHSFSGRHHHISEKECTVLTDKISSSILNLYTEDYFKHIREDLAKGNLVIVPIKILQNDTEHIQAIALFQERLLKINHKDHGKRPGIRIYRIQYAPISELMSIINTFLSSFETPLNSNWDRELNALFKAEKINQITKKELKVGNASWLTAKMLILAVAYATIFEYCKSVNLRELEADSLSIHAAEGLYKLFIVYDRNLAVREYLEMHGFPRSQESLSVTHRLDTIKEFLSSKENKQFPTDRDMLEGIYIKSLNWHLADCLKKGDIGEAHALIESEEDNPHWNPLIYAAKNGKIAIAELLGSNAHYMNLKDKLGNLPLHYAVINGDFDMCSVFIRYRKKNNIDLTIQDAAGNTALHLAVLYNHIDIIDLILIHAPELLNMKNEQGATALRLACDHHHISVIKKLISKGASLEGIDQKQYSDEIQTQLKKSGRSTLL